MAVGSRAIKAGEAFVSMMLDDEEFANSIEEWQGKFQAAARAIRPLTVALGGLGAAIVAPFAAGLRNLLGFARQVDFSAQRLGVMSGEFSRFTAIAKLTGVELDALEVGMKTIGERIIQLKAGSGETMMAFERVFGKQGIQAFLDQSNMMERMIMIAEALEKVGDAGEQSGLVLRLLGEAGNRLLPFLRLGRDELESLSAGMERIFGNDDVFLAARELGIAFDLMKLALMSASLELGAVLLPSLLEFMRVATDTVIVVKDWIRENQGLVESIFYVGLGLSALAGILGLLELGFLISSLKSVQIVFSGLVTFVQWLIPLFGSFSVGINGVTASFTGLSIALAKVLGPLTVLYASVALFSGESNPWQLLTNWTDAWVMALDRLIQRLNFLPRKLRQLSAVAGAVAQSRILGTTDAPELVAPTAAPTDAGSGAPPVAQPALITSSVASAFANQQTLGFSADVGQEQSANERTANNTEAMEKNTRELIEIFRRMVGPR